MKGSLAAAIEALEASKAEAKKRRAEEWARDQELRATGNGPPKAPEAWSAKDLRFLASGHTLKAKRAEKWRRGCDTCWTSRAQDSSDHCVDCGGLSSLVHRFNCAGLQYKFQAGAPFDWARVEVAGGQPVKDYLGSWAQAVVAGDGDVGSACLVGKPGRGKSALAHQLAVDALFAGHPVRWVGWAKHLERMRASMAGDGPADGVWSSLPSRGLVVIDDLGSVQPKRPEWVWEQTCTLLEDQPLSVTLLITTNCTPGSGPMGMGQIFGERAASRLKGACNERIFSLVGDDHRCSL